MTSCGSRGSGFIHLREGGFPSDLRPSRLGQKGEAERKPVAVISAFHCPPLIMHFKQEERGDRGENVGVIAGLLVCECLCCCRAGGGLLEGSELALSPLSWILTSFFVAVVVFFFVLHSKVHVGHFLAKASEWVAGRCQTVER